MMKHISMVFIALLFVFALHYVIPANSVSADDDKKYEHDQRGDHDKEDSPYEDIGKMVGWGTVIAMGTSGVLYPLRRSLKAVITNYPGTKNQFISISKFFGKYHVSFGIAALALGSVHGLTMYLSKGELESEGWLGLGTLAVLVVAAIFGAVLIKNKKVKKLRTTHSVLIGISILIGLVHILN